MSNFEHEQGDTQVEDKIVAIISRISGVKIDTSVDNINHIYTDSLMRLEIMTALEKTFFITLTEDIVDQFTSISRIARLVRRMAAEHVEY